MASTNQSPEYISAEKRYLEAQSDEERIECLEEMLKYVPKHKAGEAMRANLRTRYKKLKQSVEKQKKSGKSSQKNAIKKEEMQICIAGFPNTGKSTIFSTLTNKKYTSTIAPHPFSTYEPILGTTEIEDIKIQTIDLPPFPNHDKSLINITDLIILVIDNIDQIKQAEEFVKKSTAEILVIFNKADTLNDNEKRKISETLKSKFKKYPHIIFSKDPQKVEVEKLKQTILKNFIPKKVIRVYTKEPKKPVKEASKEPMILDKEPTVLEVAEKILKGMSKKVKQTKIWGPSSKFQGQVVGLDHILKDKDIIEFQTD